MMTDDRLLSARRGVVAAASILMRERRRGPSMPSENIINARHRANDVSEPSVATVDRLGIVRDATAQRRTNRRNNSLRGP